VEAYAQKSFRAVSGKKKGNLYERKNIGSVRFAFYIIETIQMTCSLLDKQRFLREICCFPLRVTRWRRPSLRNVFNLPPAYVEFYHKRQKFSCIVPLIAISDTRIVSKITSAFVIKGELFVYQNTLI